MTLNRALNNAFSGLAASSSRASLTSTNIANANTVGYVRREAELSEVTLNGHGGGVRVAGIARAQDMQLSRLRRVSDGAHAQAEVRANAQNNLNRELGDPGSDFGLFASYEGFESALRELAITPESTALQSGLLGAASTLTTQFNDLAQSGRTLRENADADIGQAVTTVNDALYQFQSLNGEIAAMNDGTSDSSALEDERQRVLDTISQYIPITDLPRGGGHLEIYTKTGVALVTEQVHELEFQPSRAIPYGTAYDDGTGLLSGLMVGDQDLTPGSGVFALGSGAISGYFAVRDTIAPQFLNRLDGMAADLIERFSDPAVDPTLAPGAPGLFTDAGNALDPTTLPGLSARLRVNAAVDPAQGGDRLRLRDGIGAVILDGAPGNSDILNGMLNAFTSSQTVSDVEDLNQNFSSVELAAAFSSLVGEARVRADAVSASTLSRSQLLYEAEIAKSGVDTDQEMQTLLLIENAYSANARVIQTVSSMFDTLLQI